MRCRRCGRYRFNPDEDIRRLERDANLGDVDAEARLIIAKVRAGIIPAKHVAIAAYLEDPAALATGIDPRDHISQSILTTDWLDVAIWKILTFGDFTQKELTTFATDFAEHVLHIFENTYPKDNRPRIAIQAIRNSSININIISDALNAYSEASRNWAWGASYAASAIISAAHTANSTNTMREGGPSSARYHASDTCSSAINSIIYASVDYPRGGGQGAAILETKWQAKRLCDYLLDRRQII